MRYYTKKHKNTCGVDLHSNNAYLCVLNELGEKVKHKRVNNSEAELDKELIGYEDLVLSVESTYNWYWLGDYCHKRGIKFVLGHALYMKAINAGKTKNDRIDSEKIARLTQAQLLPEAYAYPEELRKVRDLLRRRLYYVRARAALKGHIKIVAHQYNYPLKALIGHSSRSHNKILECFKDEVVREAVANDLLGVMHLSALIKRIEKYVVGQVAKQRGTEYELLKTMTGVGPIIAMTVIYEIDSVERFGRCQDFMSYARLVRSSKTSNDKKVGKGGSKIGNPFLKWAFSELAVHIIRDEKVAVYLELLKLRYGKAGAWSRVTQKSARTVYYMLKNKQPFSLKHFLQDSKIVLESSCSLEPNTKEATMVID